MVASRFVIFRVQHLIANAHSLQDSAQFFEFLDRNSAHQHRLPGFVQFLDFLRRVAEFFLFRAIHDVVKFLAQQRHIRRNLRDFQFINLVTNSAASVSAVPVMLTSFLYMRK